MLGVILMNCCMLASVVEGQHLKLGHQRVPPAQPPHRSNRPLYNQPFVDRHLFPAATLVPLPIGGAKANAAVSDPDMLTSVARVAEDAGRAASDIIKSRLGAAVIETKANFGDLLTEVDGLVQSMIEDRVRKAFPSHGFLGEESVQAGAKASTEALDAAMQASQSDWLWIVDPLDGTTNFVQSIPLVGVSIGVAHRDGARGPWKLVVGVIVDVFHGEVFLAYAGGGAFLDGKPIHVGNEQLSEGVVATGIQPYDARRIPTVRGIGAVAARARSIRMLGSAAIMLAWVATGRLSAYFEIDLNPWDTAAGVLLVRESGGLVTDLTGAPFEITTRPLLASNPAAHAEMQATLAEAGVAGLEGPVTLVQTSAEDIAILVAMLVSFCASGGLILAMLRSRHRASTPGLLPHLIA